MRKEIRIPLLIWAVFEIIAVCSAENRQKNNGHTIQTDCVTVFISVVLPTLFASISYLRGSLIAACAAARRAIGTRKGEQET